MIELIHLHIPKTGGRSFFRVLKSAYGDDAVDGPRNRGPLFNNIANPTLLSEIIPKNKKVLYGHLNFKHVLDVVERDKPEIITWLRHPVDRVISHYYFKMRKHVEEPDNVNKHFSIQTSLMEYAKDEKNLNVMSRFLKGIKPEELFFIGTLENNDADIKILAKKLKWKNYKLSVHVNDNKEFKKNPKCKTTIVTQEMRDEILKLNLADMELYSMALELREKHINELGFLYKLRNFKI